MKRTFFKPMTVLLFGSFLSLMASTTYAGWGSLGGSYGSFGGGSYGGSSGYVTSYGSYGSAGYGSAGYGSTGYGSTGAHHFTPIRSMLRGIHNHIAAKVERHHARRAAYASYGSVGYSSVGYGSGGYSSVGYGSTGYSAGYGSTGSVSYGSVGSGVSYGSVGTAVPYSTEGSILTPESSPAPQGASYYGTPDSLSNSSSLISATKEMDDDSVYLTISLPSEARVYVNGKATTSTGDVRQFVSRGLVPGKTYKFDVRAELDSADGQVQTAEKTIVVDAGSQEQLQFAFVDSPVQTSLTLNVPEQAKVYLAGNPTRATGTHRTYQSQQLTSGQVWDDYTIEVELDGQVKRQTVQLIGGDNLELTFHFDDQPADQIALNR